MTSPRDVLLAAAVALLAVPSLGVAETYAFKIDSKLNCSGSGKPVDPTPADKIVVTLERQGGAAKDAVLWRLPTKGNPVSHPADPGSTADRAQFTVSRNLVTENMSLRIGDTKAPEALKCPEVLVTPSGATGSQALTSAATGARPPASAAITHWQGSGAAELEALKKNRGYPQNTQFLVHYDNGDPAPPFPSSISEREPVQIAIVLPVDATPELALVVNSCEAVSTFRIRPPAGQLQASRTEAQYRVVPYGALLRCGAGKLTYSLTVAGVTREQSVRVRPVTNLAFTVAYGFDMTSVPSYAVENGTVTRTSDRAGLGLRLGFTWFPLGVDYEDMRWWNHVNPTLAVDPTAPTENFLVGGTITPTGGFGVIVGANFRRISVPKGVAVGGSFAGTDVPTEKQWNHRGIGLYLGISVDDDVFAAIKGRLGQ
jgi:hypothetical protein